MPIFVAGYSNEARRIDAAISDRWWTKEVGCRMVAYATNGIVYSVSNYLTETDLDFDPAFLILHAALGSEPGQLTVELTKLIAQQPETELLATPVYAFGKRYQAISDRQLAETKHLIEQKIRLNPISDPQWRPLRFERRQMYLDFRGFNDPEYSSRQMAESLLHQVSTGACHRFESCQQVIRDCLNLLGMQRMQYAGAPPTNEFLRFGIEAGCKLFQNLRTVWQKELKAYLVNDLSMAMLFCFLAGDYPSLTAICDAADPNLLHGERHPEDPPLDIGLALFVIVSHFRSAALPEEAEFKSQILHRQTRRTKTLKERALALVAACENLQQRDAVGLRTALVNSTKLFKKLKDPVPGAH